MAADEKSETRKKWSMKQELCPSRDLQRWIYLHLLRQVPPPHRVRLHLKVRGCRQASRQQDERWSKLIRRSVDFSSATKGCIPWRVNWKAAGETRRIKKKKIQKTPTILRLRSGNPLPKTVKLGGNPCAHGASSSVDKEIQKDQERHGTTTSKYRRIHASDGSRLLHGQENLWKTTWRSYERLECEFATWWMFMNTTLQAGVHLGKDCDTNLRHREEPSLNSLWQWLDRTKTYQWSIRNPWSTNTRDRGLKTIEFEETTWRSTSSVCERAFQITNTKVYIFSDSVLCVERCEMIQTLLEE